MKKIILATLMTASLISCGKSDDGSGSDQNGRNDLTITNKVVSSSFVGSGAQWGGYDNIESWTGSKTFSEQDWATLFSRVEYMRPGLVRIMVSSGWNYMINGQYNPSKSDGVLIKIMDFCQSKGIKVLIGEWGHEGGASIDEQWLGNAVNFLDYLVNTKGYTCIKYYNMCNEPNGNWSTINSNYPLWESLIKKTYVLMQDKGLTSKVKIIGPDVAVWGTDFISWIDRAKKNLSAELGAYDIHTYPTEGNVHEGTYMTMIESYCKAVPAGKDMLMGELGFKYGASTALGIENAKRIAADQYASDDSNMMIYDAFYGVDMAEAYIQNMLAGYKGIIAWGMDDAMYSVEGKKLKKWGFWNILGQEAFAGAQEENIRPWFYTTSLLCRYFPAGADILGSQVPDKRGVRAVGAVLGGKYTLAIVNSHSVAYNINLKLEAGQILNGAKMFKYVAGNGSLFEGKLDANGFAAPYATSNLDFSNNKAFELVLPARSFILITTME